jgi:hypothetical protein
MTKMKYKVTQQFAKGEELALASFLELNEAIFFINKKIISDTENHKTLIYHLFDGQKLFKDFNVDKVNCIVRPGQYTSLDRDLPNTIGPFCVSTDQSPIHAFAAFTDLADAELYVEEKLTHANETPNSKDELGGKNEIKYYIFKNNVLITVMDQHVKRQIQENETKQGQGQSSSFRPTPFNTSPRPAGAPHAWVKDDDKEDKNNK